MAYPGANLYLVLKEKLAHKIVIGMSYNKGKCFHLKIEIRDKNPQKGIPGGFEPKGQRGVVDMPKAVCVAEPRLNNSSEHKLSIMSNFAEYTLLTEESYSII